MLDFPPLWLIEQAHSWEEIALAVSAVIAALTAAGALTIRWWHSCRDKQDLRRKQYERIVDHWEEHDEMLKDMQDSLLRVMAQVLPNGGSSMRDEIKKINERTVETRDRVCKIETRLDEHIAYHLRGRE